MEKASVFLLFFFILNFHLYGLDVASTKVENMTLDQKVGQLFMIGISDQELSKASLHFLKKFKPGSVILFKRNIRGSDQVKKLNAALKQLSFEYSNVPLIIATDQEGGRVSRVEMDPPLPSPLALGKTNNPQLIEDISYASAKLLSDLGFNMNLAPVLDVLLKNKITFIGERSFGNDSESVSKLGVSFAVGQLRAGVIPTSKHFPGAGVLQNDPHLKSVTSLDLKSDFLDPFLKFSKLYPSAMMISHSSYPALDPSLSPATFSKAIIQDLLIDQWKYKGLIITDDLQMGAAKNSSISMEELALKSIRSGADIIMVTWGPQTQDLIKKGIIRAVKSGQLSEQELNNHVQKILNIKDVITRTPAAISKSEYSALEHKVLNINLERDLRGIQKIRLSDKIAVISDNTNFNSGFSSFLKKPLSLFSTSVLSNQQESLRLNSFHRLIVYINTKKQSLALSSLPLSIKKKMLIVSSIAPGFLVSTDFGGMVELFHPHKDAGQTLAEKLFY